MMRRQLERYGRWLFAIAFLAAVAVVCGSSILVRQHLANPFADTLEIHAELSTSNGLNPGLAQPVNVAGVRVGTIAGARVRDGRARVRMTIDRDELPRVYDNAHATLVPNTALKDMQIELAPGGPPGRPLADGATIPVARTAAPIDSDELTRALDADTRDFFEILVSGVDRGTRGRGRDLRGLLRALAPTARQVAELNGTLAARRRAITRLVTNLAALSRATGRSDRQLAGLVDGADRTLGALASEQRALGDAVARLPGTLSAARTSLRHATTFAGELGPALTALRPTARRLPATLRALRPFTAEGAPILRDRLRRFAVELQPVAADLAPAARDLNAVTPFLAVAFGVLDHVANTLGHNPPGSDEGYLYWLAWFAHNGASVTSTQDAHGAVLRGLGLVSCDTLLETPAIAPLVQLLTGPIGAC